MKIGIKLIKEVKEMKILKFEPAMDGSPTSPKYVTIPIRKEWNF